VTPTSTAPFLSVLVLVCGLVLPILDHIKVFKFVVIFSFDIGHMNSQQPQFLQTFIDPKIYGESGTSLFEWY
jgi:hypothetical protein